MLPAIPRAQTTHQAPVSNIFLEASPKRGGVRSQGSIRRKKRKRQREAAQQEHAELLAHARAAQQAAYVIGLGAVTVGQDTPPMSAASEQASDRASRSPESSVYYAVPYSHKNHRTASSTYAPSRYGGGNSLGRSSSSRKSSNSGVPTRERLHTPDLEMMKMAMHGSLFQRMRQNFRAGMFGDGTVNVLGDRNKGFEIMRALNAGESESEIESGKTQTTTMIPMESTFYEQDMSTMMALRQRQPPQATTVLFGEGSPLSRQGFASMTPPDLKLKSVKTPKTKGKRPAKSTAFKIAVLEKNIDPNFSRRLLPLVDASHYWDVRNVSHELKWSAIAIQRMIRGLLARLFTAEFRYRIKLAKMKKAHDAATQIQRIVRGYLSVHAAHDKALASKEGQFLIRSSLCNNPYKMKLSPLLKWMKRISVGSQGVQKIFRGMIGRRLALGHKIDVLRKRLEKKSATSIQALFRCYRTCILWRVKLVKYNIIRIWIIGRLAKLHAIELGKQVRAHYLHMKAAAMEIQRWFPRAVETRGLARYARENYLNIRRAIIILQSFNRMVIATNRMHYLSAVREQERLAERRRIERERIEELERQRIARWTKAAIIVQNWVRYLQAVVKVRLVRIRKSEREAVYDEAKLAFERFKNIIPENKDVRKLTAKPLLGFIFMHIEPPVSEDIALLSGKGNGSLELDIWYQHNLMTQPREALLHYARSLVEYYRTLKLDGAQVQESLRKGQLLDAGLVQQSRLVDIIETSWRQDMDNGFKGCIFALARTLFLNDMLGAARAMRRARKNSKYDAKIVAHAKRFEKDFSALVARGDHFVDQIYETTMVLPPQRAKFRVQVLQHENNLQFRSLRSDFVAAGVKPSGAETRLVFTHLDVINIATQLDRPELTRSGRVQQLVLELMTMLRLETGAASDKMKSRRPGTKKKKSGGQKAGGKRLAVRFKQEPFPKLTVLTKGKGTKSLPSKFLTVIVLHREDGGFDFWAKGDMTDPPAGNPEDEYKLVLPFKRLKLLFMDYPVLWKSRQRPGWRRRSDQLIALVLERMEVSQKPKPQKKGVHQMSFEELMRMSAAVDQQKKQREGDKKGEKVPDVPPELVLVYHNEDGRVRQASLNYGAMALQRCWRGLKGRKKAKMERKNQASFTIVGFIKYNRARIWFRDVCIFAKQHFRSIEMQSVARGFLVRLSFRQRLTELFPFSRGSWALGYTAMIAQRPLPLENGNILVSDLELSALTQRIMWGLAVTDDDKQVCSILNAHDSLRLQPNLMYALAIATRIANNSENVDNVDIVRDCIQQARVLDPERGRKFLIVRDMFFERWRNIQCHNALKTLRCAVMYEIVYNDYDQAQDLYVEAERLLKLKPDCHVKRKWQANYTMFQALLLRRVAAAKSIQTLYRGHCNKRVNGEWLAALIKFRRTSLMDGFTGTLAQALGSHYLWHNLDRAAQLYSTCHKMDAMGTLLTNRGRHWMETQFALIDKLQRGGLTEKQYHILLEKATLPEEIESLEPTLEEVANEESEAKADVGDISQLKTPLNNLETERDDKTHIFQPRSQSARDIFNAIGTADADEVPQLQSDTDAQSQREEEEEERERTQVETDAMDYFGDMQKNEDGLRVSVDSVWNWGVSMRAGQKERPIFDVASALISVLQNDSISSVTAWGKALQNAEETLEEKNLTAETFDNNTVEAKAAVLELETHYIRLAARMPQERSASLLNHALFLHVVRRNVESAGNSYSSALRENPGYVEARRGYEYFLNRGMLSAISEKQQKIQARMRRKKAAKTWRRGAISVEQRIEKHLSILLEVAYEATAEYEQAEADFSGQKVKAKKINKIRSKNEYTNEDQIEMKEYRRLKRLLQKKEIVMKEADEKVMSLRKGREDRRVREN
jgi:hypothetical protein